MPNLLSQALIEVVSAETERKAIVRHGNQTQSKSLNRSFTFNFQVLELVPIAAWNLCFMIYLTSASLNSAQLISKSHNRHNIAKQRAEQWLTSERSTDAIIAALQKSHGARLTALRSKERKLVGTPKHPLAPDDRLVKPPLNLLRLREGFPNCEQKGVTDVHCTPQAVSIAATSRDFQRLPLSGRIQRRKTQWRSALNRLKKISMWAQSKGESHGQYENSETPQNRTSAASSADMDRRRKVDRHSHICHCNRPQSFLLLPEFTIVDLRCQNMLICRFLDGHL